MKKIQLWLALGLSIALIHIVFFQYSMAGYNNSVQNYNQEVLKNDGANGTYDVSYSALLPLSIIDFPAVFVGHHITLTPPYFSISTPHFFDVYLGSGNSLSDNILLLLGTVQWFIIGSLFGLLIGKIYKAKQRN